MILFMVEITFQFDIMFFKVDRECAYGNTLVRNFAIVLKWVPL